METVTNNDIDNNIDTGLACLVIAARLLDIPADREQLKRAFVVGSEPLDKLTLLRAARELGIKARLNRPAAEKLTNFPLPCIGILTNGDFVVLGRCDGRRIKVLNPREPQPANILMEEFLALWSGELVMLARRFSLKSIDKHFSLSWFIPVILKYKQLFVEVFAASFFLQLLGLVTPLFTQVIIDKVLVHKGLATLDILAIGMFCIAAFSAWMGYLRTYIFAHTTNKVDVILGTKLFRHLTALPLKYFESRRVGDTVARVRELDNIRQFITGSGLTVVLDAIFTVIFIAVMVVYSPRLSIIALLAIPGYGALSLIVTPLYREQLRQHFNAGAENHSYLVETVTGIQTVKSLAVEPKFINRWEELLAGYVKISFSTINLANIASNTGQFIQQTFNMVILWFGAHQVIAGDMTVGELIAFQMLAAQVNAPILRLINIWQSFQQTMISVERLGDILNSPPEPSFNPNRTTLPKIRGDIVFNQVTFRYRAESSEVLSKMSFHVPPGARIGIVGRSGSGKSTIAKLIQCLYIPESGRVLIDGVDLAQIEPAWLRRQIGVVLQESFLFSGSIRENIALANPGAPMHEIIRAAKIAGAHDFILELSEGYDTNVGERGAALSGGQKQRIAIARALLTNPRLLIFDEATSALDYESESIILNNMGEICRGRTAIFIAHRLSTVRSCDRIIVLEKGRLVEQGSHADLLRSGGFYHKLYRFQEGTNEIHIV